MTSEEMKSRVDIINMLIEKHKYENYLEIGVFNPKRCFDKVKVKDKIGVDPGLGSRATHIETSDSFFSNLDKDKKFDIIFIDGDHYHDQVIKDIDNALNHLSEKGTIVLHDMLYEDPVSPMNSRGTTCWKAFAALRTKRKDLLMATIELDMGVSIIQKLSDFDLQYRLLPRKFKMYSKDKLVLNAGVLSDSISEKAKNNEKRIRKYCQRCCNDYSWDDDKRIHERWVLNYFEDNYRHLMNSYSIEEFLVLFSDYGNLQNSSVKKQNKER